MAHYKVLSFDKYSGSLVVQFAENMAPISIDVPLDNDNLFISGQVLEQYIQGFIPTWHMERLEKLKNGVANANEIESLIVSTEEMLLPSAAIVSDEEKANIQMWADVAEEQRIAKILIKFGVLAENPTEIQTSNL